MSLFLPYSVWLFNCSAKSSALCAPLVFLNISASAAAAIVVVTAAAVIAAAIEEEDEEKYEKDDAPAVVSVKA